MKYQGFTLKLAMVDCIPVICFLLATLRIYHFFPSMLFLFGALTCVLGASLKVTWKFILALKQQNIFILSKQMRYTMSLGFGLMLLSTIIHHHLISLKAIFFALRTFPTSLFLLISFSCLMAMSYCARHLDQSDASHNWLEQCINILAQITFLCAIYSI